MSADAAQVAATQEAVTSPVADATTLKSTASKKRFSLLNVATKLVKSRSKEGSTPMNTPDAAAAKNGEKGWAQYQAKIRAVGKVSTAFRLAAPDTAQVFSPYLPRMLQQELIDRSFRGRGLELEFTGSGRSVEAAVMFSDASGFTQLTEKLAQQPNGAETMCAIMNSYLTLMITTISAHGGDVVKFAGDALLVVFPIDTSGARLGSFPDAKTAVMQATCCAQSLATSLHNWTALDDPVTGKRFTLSLHIGVGVGAGDAPGQGGTLTALHVGGIHDQWEFVLAGPPMVQVNTAEPLATSGEVCVSAEAWALIEPHATAHPAPDDDGRGFKIIDSVRTHDGVISRPGLPAGTAVSLTAFQFSFTSRLLP